MGQSIVDEGAVPVASCLSTRVSGGGVTMPLADVLGSLNKTDCCGDGSGDDDLVCLTTSCCGLFHMEGDMDDVGDGDGVGGS